MFTDEEAKVYDRQIRLWGVNAQQKIRATDVFLVCLDGLASEVVKNLVLAGINSITILDDQPVSQFDMLNNIFSQNQIGMNRAEACQKAVNQLNPMVKVNIMKDQTLSTLLSDEMEAKNFLKSFNVVILVNNGLDMASKLNEFCHQLCIPFFFTCSWGYLSMTFIDIGKQYNGIDFIPIGDAFEKKTISLKNSRRRRQGENISKREMIKIENLKSLFLSILTIFRYHKKMGEFPNVLTESDQQQIENQLKTIEQEILDELNQQNDDDNDGDDKQQQQQQQRWTSTTTTTMNYNWTKKIYGQFSFISSIVGGFLSQEVIRTVTNDESIDYNTFFYYEINGHNLNIGI
ncbi:SUMO1 activating enzyme subunit 1 [Dermatophagoides pteronyssinus]|uniref:SUMO1 activating enzyme subunit 1 n=1 Tax=Dermatophagoides pteronyssinus TaxID=6956 RepID=UPI003F66287B